MSEDTRCLGAEAAVGREMLLAGGQGQGPGAFRGKEGRCSSDMLGMLSPS